MINDKDLMKIAEEARKKAYTPYSRYKVGAALVGKDGKIYAGCNIENATFTPTVCAERTAFFKAISEGTTEFEKIAITGAKEGETSDNCTPCGVCRQVMAEFCDKNFKLVLGNSDNIKTYTLDEILPFSFTKKEL